MYLGRLLINSAPYNLSSCMNPKAKIPSELQAIAMGCCVFGVVLTVTASISAVFLPRYPLPDKVRYALYKDPSARPLIICEQVGGILLGAMAFTAGLMVLARAKAASPVLYATLALAAVGIATQVVVEGWLIVPALTKVARDLKFPEALRPDLKFPEAIFYDPRLRPAFPIAVGIVALALLYGITRTLRRPHVRAALANGPGTRDGASMK